jgi:hypothetical protein
MESLNRPNSTVSALKPLRERKDFKKIKSKKKGQFRCLLLIFHDKKDSHCWDGVDDLVQLQVVEDGGLSGSIKSEHQHSGILGEVGIEDLGKNITHFVFCLLDCFEV